MGFQQKTFKLSRQRTDICDLQEMNIHLQIKTSYQQSSAVVIQATASLAKILVCENRYVIAAKVCLDLYICFTTFEKFGSRADYKGFGSS